MLEKGQAVEREYDYAKILQGILDIGEAMLICGAEVSRAEDSMYRMCRAYGFVRYDVFVIVSNLQATIETKEGEIITQIRHISRSATNYDRLDYLNNLSRYVVKKKPDHETIHKKFEEVMSRKPQPKWMTYLAGIMGGAGFGVFFGCDVMDTIVATIASILVVFLGFVLANREENPFVYNFVIMFLVEIYIILSCHFGMGNHSGRITIGVVMLLISGLGTTNGFRDLLHKDIFSGFLNILNSMLGAAALAAGIALAIILLKGVVL
ncbi:MAG: threonine/serine exporter family protein [Eubacterium sp.]|nr:threonine/serine exporter family protein [Eubacterium sp.]MCH4047756.1 threonine/serine exporter family protein [Eubacterium sp.]MCH4078528.1 threonine/serine exporter family protein [Eubacterium sp.]MCH4109672.1 threonine/serine exporter family protein [Eubacterium sp.]MCI1308043.1 threonine/serine exporter family protein [Eubacterium sp.]